MKSRDIKISVKICQMTLGKTFGNLSTSTRGKDTLLCVNCPCFFNCIDTVSILLAQLFCVAKMQEERAIAEFVPVSESRKQNACDILPGCSCGVKSSPPSYHLKTTKTLLVPCRQSQDARRQQALLLLLLLLLLLWPEQCQIKHQRWEKSLERRFITALLADTSYNLSFHRCRRKGK